MTTKETSATARRDKSKAYKLFSEGKRSVQVAITLNLREMEEKNQ
jgi:hypothetical protein